MDSLVEINHVATSTAVIGKALEVTISETERAVGVFMERAQVVTVGFEMLRIMTPEEILGIYIVFDFDSNIALHDNSPVKRRRICYIGNVALKH
jgi:hypothetical protein